jgi:hypothetical protein
LEVKSCEIPIREIPRRIWTVRSWEGSGPLIVRKEVVSLDFGKRERSSHHKLPSREIPTRSKVGPQVELRGHMVRRIREELRTVSLLGFRELKESEGLTIEIAKS